MTNKKEPVLIAICGFKGSGKSTVASRIRWQLNARRVRFAGPLKGMLAAFGLTEDEIEGGLKEAPCEKLCGKTPRHAMITLGTEWGREMIGPDIWTRAWERAAKSALDQGLDVITEDLRFPNEFEAVRRLGGLVLRVVRPGLAAGEHESEAHAMSFQADIECSNDGDIDDLNHWAKRVFPSDLEFAVAAARRQGRL